MTTFLLPRPSSLSFPPFHPFPPAPTSPTSKPPPPLSSSALFPIGGEKVHFNFLCVYLCVCVQDVHVAWHCVASGHSAGPSVIKCTVTGAAPLLDR